VTHIASFFASELSKNLIDFAATRILQAASPLYRRICAILESFVSGYLLKNGELKRLSHIKGRFCLIYFLNLVK
jgi:hypothetical protein